MGVVYLARDPLIGRPVALKALHRDLDSRFETQQAKSRFIREAEAAGALSHPNIVTIYDVADEGPGGETFLAMEYIEGASLREIVASGEEMPFEQVVNLVSQIAAALDYAHAAGVVHRDIKPANILVTPEGRVKITDFGIAHLDSSAVTQDLALAGTPNYMPPEMMHGRFADHRGDIFSLGVVLYEMITHHTPFVGSSLADLVRSVSEGDFVPAKRWVPDLPAGMSRVLSTALHPDPEQRYQRAGELAADLRRVLFAASSPDGSGLSDTQVLPAAAFAARTSRRFRRWRAGLREWRRAGGPRRLLRVLAVAAAASALLALLGRVWLTDQERKLQTDPPDNRALAQYLALLRKGKAALSADPQAAVQTFARAERLLPGRPGAQRLREEAEDTVHARMVAADVTAARQALVERRYTAALQAVSRLLEAGPQEQEAKQVLGELERALAARDRPSGSLAAPRWGLLQLALDDGGASGSLTIYAGDRQILRQRFVDLRRSAKDLPNDPSRQHVLPAGHLRLRVYVTLAHDPARLVSVSGDLPAGSTRVLNVRISRHGDVTAFLS